MITITPFEEFYTQDVIDLVLHFQNDGTRPIVTVEDQPDLLHITDAYFRIGGSFWIARDGFSPSLAIQKLPPMRK